MVTKVKLIQLRCKRCSHKWVPIKKIIRVCPKCKSPYWDVDRMKKHTKTHIIKERKKKK